MAPKIEQLLVNSKILDKVGSIIVNDTAQLAANLCSFFNGQGETDALFHNLPACLQADFAHYEQQQKAEFDELLRQRKQTGELLSQASNLVDFKKRVDQDASVDLYKVTTCYQCEYVPEHLRSPDSSKS